MALTAAILIAAVFVCAFVFRNELLFQLAKRQIASLNLPGKTLQLTRLSSDEFKLEMITVESNSLFISYWRPQWDFARKELHLSGQIKVQSHDIVSQIGIPFEVSMFPISRITVKCSGVYQETKWSVQTRVSDIRKNWEGEGELALSDPSWGELNPEFKFKLGEEVELSMVLEPGKIKSQWLQVKESARGQLRQEGLGDQFRFSASLPSFSIDGVNLKSVKSSVFSAKVEGQVGLDPKSDVIYTLKGNLKDQQNTIRIPLTIRGVNQEPEMTSQFEVTLFEGSLAAILLKEIIPGMKLLTGKLTGQLKNQEVQLFLEPTSLVFADHLFSGLEGKARGNWKKLALSLREVQFGFADGVVKLQPFAISKKSPETTLSFYVERLQLNKILSSYSKSKLNGQGLFHGKGILKMNSEGVSVSMLDLINSTPGIIKYSDSSQPYFERKIVYLDEFEDLLAQGQQALVLKALENFHYTSFQVKADRPFPDHLKVLLNLKGKNPDLAKGQIFDITLPIEGNIDSLVKGSLLQQPVADELHKRHLEME